MLAQLCQLSPGNPIREIKTPGKKKITHSNDITVTFSHPLLNIPLHRSTVSNRLKKLGLCIIAGPIFVQLHSFMGMNSSSSTILLLWGLEALARAPLYWCKMCGL